jgi:seryl-tRNA synthetase
LSTRGEGAEYVDKILQLDAERRECIGKTEGLKSIRNIVSAEIAKMKKAGEDASGKISEMKKTSDDIKSLDEKLNEIEKQINEILINIPNLPAEGVPIGKTADENVEVRK